MIFSNHAGTMSESFAIGKRGVKLLQGTTAPNSDLKAPIGSLYLKKSGDTVRVYQLVALETWEPLLVAGSVPFLLATADDNIPNGIVVGTSGSLDFNPTTGVFKIANNPSFAGLGGLVPPSGSTLQRPSSPIAGQFRYNSTEAKLEAFQGGEWKYLAGDSNSAPRSYQRQLTANDSGILTVEHNLNQKYVMVSVYDSDDYTVVPDRIKMVSETQLEIHLNSFETVENWTILVTR